MAKRRYTAEEIMTVLRQVEVAIANGKTTPRACRESEIAEQTYYRWRKEYGGLKLEQAKRLKALEKENSQLRRLVAELSLEKQILQDVAPLFGSAAVRDVSRSTSLVVSGTLGT